MGKQIDWDVIEAQYRANVASTNELAKRHGITEGAIRARAKKHGWVKDPEGTKRRIVREQMAGITKGVANYEVRNIIESEAAIDVQDMRDCLGVARAILAKQMDTVPTLSEPRDLKVAAETLKINMETIRRIRGLDEDKGAIEGIEALLGKLDG